MEFAEGFDHSQYVYLAKLAKQTERYEEMARCMEKIIRRPSFKHLTAEERALFYVAYKNVVGSRRSTWRVFTSMENKEESRRNEANAAIIKRYRQRLESELSSICDGVIGLLDSYLIPSARSADSKAFYLKLKGDFYRYLAEFRAGEERLEAAKEIAAAYHAAQNISHADLGPTHPVRLGVDLNLSVFFYEIMNSSYKARSIAEQALKGALADINNLNSDFYKESAHIMNVLRDNLTRWNADAQQRTVKAQESYISCSP